MTLSHYIEQRIRHLVFKLFEVRPELQEYLISETVEDIVNYAQRDD